jgi:methylated-DNA-[protein]-cysteine S-methyltransferase
MNKQAYLETPIGVLELQGSVAGISAIRLSTASVVPEAPVPACLAEGVRQLSEYFAGNRQQFDLLLDFGKASPFFTSVWHQLMQVPFGEITTYQAIAHKLENQGAVRAVGMANSRNPIAIVVPCHRCIASSGRLQGYFYGLDIKRRLLQHERPRYWSAQGNLFEQPYGKEA